MCTIWIGLAGAHTVPCSRVPFNFVPSSKSIVDLGLVFVESFLQICYKHCSRIFVAFFIRFGKLSLCDIIGRLLLRESGSE